MSGVICNRKAAARFTRDTMYDLSVVRITKAQEAKLEMLRFILGVTNMD